VTSRRPARGVRGAASVLLLLVAIPACGDGKPKSTASATSGLDLNSTIPITTGPAPSTSTTTTTAPSACTAGPRPAGAVRVTSAPGDFNGDGTPDTLVVYGTGTDDAPAPYMVRVELGDGGGSVETPIVDAATDPNQNVKALGGADISTTSGGSDDGSGVEAFVAVGSGASTFLVGFYQLGACELVRLAGAGGSTPAELPVGGTVTHLSGVRCDAGSSGTRLVQVAAESTDGVTYATTEQTFDVTDAKLVPAGPPVAGTRGGTDPELSRFSGLDCAGVSPI
jgi:hypothetical protein